VNFVLPSNLTKIGLASFSGCKSLTHFWIVASVEAIELGSLQRSGIANIWVHAENAHFKRVDDFVVTRDEMSLVC
jgi:hypothetical protein